MFCWNVLFLPENVNSLKTHMFPHIFCVGNGEGKKSKLNVSRRSNYSVLEGNALDFLFWNGFSFQNVFVPRHQILWLTPSLVFFWALCSREDFVIRCSESEQNPRWNHRASCEMGIAFPRQLCVGLEGHKTGRDLLGCESGLLCLQAVGDQRNPSNPHFKPSSITMRKSIPKHPITCHSANQSTANALSLQQRSWFICAQKILGKLPCPLLQKKAKTLPLPPKYLIS